MQLYVFLIILYLSFINKSNQNNIKKRERLENAIKFMITLMKGELNSISYSFEYNKYTIILNKIKILNPMFLNDINFIQEQNNIIVNNIKLTFMMDINIKYFSNSDKLINYKNLFIEAIYKELIFQIIDDFNIQFISIDINNINIVENNMISGLDFFRNFTDKKHFIFNNEENFNDKKLKNMFFEIFYNKIKEIEEYYNLLSYDMMLIINNCTKMTDFDDILFEDVQINNILTSLNYFHLNKKENSIKISNLTIIGVYSIPLYEDVNFNFFCGSQINHIIYEPNKYIRINIDDCKLIDDCEIEEIFGVEVDSVKNLIKVFENIINKNAENYYKNIFEI